MKHIKIGKCWGYEHNKAIDLNFEKNKLCTRRMIVLYESDYRKLVKAGKGEG